MYKESETVELKEKLTKDIKKEIIAFANSKGGTIYIGITDDGKVIGVINSKEDIEAISGMIREGIKSDLSLCTKIFTDNINEKEVIVVNVISGTNKPYYLADKGMNSSGVYIRHGNVSAPASDEVIRKLIKENVDTFELEITNNQDLNFDYFEKTFADKNIKLTKQKYKTLGLINKYNLYTNLGLLFSNECPFSIKIGVFEGKNKLVFKDRKEFKGCLFKQLDDALGYLNLVNRIKGVIVGYKRVDTRDYPEYVLREGLLNAIIHRSYHYEGSIIISVFDDRIEIISLGSLVNGVNLNDLFEGVSERRNPHLAEIFHRLEYVESFGTGIGKIMNAYKDYTIKPDFHANPNSFKVIFPNVNYVDNEKQELIPINLNQEEKIVMYLKENNKITREEVEVLLNINKSRAALLIKEMLNKELLIKKGNGKNIYYILN